MLFFLAVSSFILIAVMRLSLKNSQDDCRFTMENQGYIIQLHNPAENKILDGINEIILQDKYLDLKSINLQGQQQEQQDQELLKIFSKVPENKNKLLIPQKNQETDGINKGNLIRWKCQKTQLTNETYQYYEYYSLKLQGQVDAFNINNDEEFLNCSEMKIRLIFTHGTAGISDGQNQLKLANSSRKEGSSRKRWMEFIKLAIILFLAVLLLFTIFSMDSQSSKDVNMQLQEDRQNNSDSFSAKS